MPLVCQAMPCHSCPTPPSTDLTAAHAPLQSGLCPSPGWRTKVLLTDVASLPPYLLSSPQDPLIGLTEASSQSPHDTSRLSSNHTALSIIAHICPIWHLMMKTPCRRRPRATSSLSPSRAWPNISRWVSLQPSHCLDFQQLCTQQWRHTSSNRSSSPSGLMLQVKQASASR